MLIFLDIDGVLNQLQRDYIDETCVANLAVLVHKLNAKIVLSSTWRFGFMHDFSYCTPQIQHLIKVFQSFNLQIWSRTGIKLRTRSKEIQSYLREHPDDYIVLDDDASLFSNIKNLYLVNYKTGLTSKDVKKILKKVK